jgi:hypothetical protein
MYLRNWKVPFKELDGGKVGEFMERTLLKLKTPLSLPAS